MKMFKKLMAVALAGVLALTVLTGCGASSFNKKEFINTLNDSLAMSAYYKIVFEDAGSAQADKVIPLVQKAYEEAAKAENFDPADFDPMDALEDGDNGHSSEYYSEYKAVAKALGVDEKTKDEYKFNVVKIEQYNTKFNQKLYGTVNFAINTYHSAATLNDVDADGNKGTISLNTVTLGDAEYLVVVFKQLA